MAGSQTVAPSGVRRRRSGGLTSLTAGSTLGLGLATLALSLIVLIPLAAVVARGFGQGWHGFWAAVTAPDAWAALRLTLGASALVCVVNIVMGTLIAWVLVRDEFPGKRALEAVVDLPFALPTIVAGLVLLALYGPNSPVGVNVAFTRTAVFLALLFVTLPFVVRTTEPVLAELDQEMEEAAASLGAGRFTIFRRIVLPNLLPAISAGAGLSFARAISEFGATILVAGTAGKTAVIAVQIYNSVENDQNGKYYAAAAVATELLVIALVVIVALDLFQRCLARRV